MVVALTARVVRRRRDFGSSADRATFETLHTASLAAPSLRDGLTASGAERAVKHLRTLLGTPAVALVDAAGHCLAWDGAGGRHAADVGRHAGGVLTGGQPAVASGPAVGQGEEARCDDPDCPVRTAVVAPIVSGDTVVGALLAYGGQTSAGLVRATSEVARYVSSQVALAEVDRERTRAMEAELRALRAQISPHFVYNSLAAIASFVRTDPEQARELLLEFADFTRYAFRRGGEFTTLADELSNVERYLRLEQARFGERLQISLLVAPEVLSVAVPYLVLQPLVENAVRHGLADRTGPGHIVITAEDGGSEALLSVEDDGAGSDPEVVRAVLSGESSADSVGLGNVDARLRQVFGDGYGLVVETAPGAGTRVSLRVPKYAPGVAAR
ncbi:sensor histidine kinase [Angustibacter luteus]|uniref:Sensor histidine kinase n=1 Tax=Angustibacter luteus TaxID=658456 RepID=A0ABW1JDP3_9ACTN